MPSIALLLLNIPAIRQVERPFIRTDESRGSHSRRQMYRQNESNNQCDQRPEAKLVQLETFLAAGTPDSFYTGFSGRIQDGGVFVTTYQLLEKFTPVEVTIHFPDGKIIRPRGTVEWIREVRNGNAETPPGMGISFTDLRSFEVELIDTWLLSHPPVFLDNVDVLPVVSRYTDISDNIELENLPINLGPGCDLNPEHLFVNGLARDITHYLNERPLNYLKSRIEREKRVLKKKSARKMLTVRVTSSPPIQRVQGAFDTEDGSHRLFVHTPSPEPIGHTIQLQLLCISGVRIGCTGKVRWIRKANPLINPHTAPPGMGIVLRDMKPTVWKTINPQNAEIVFCEAL